MTEAQRRTAKAGRLAIAFALVVLAASCATPRPPADPGPNDYQIDLTGPEDFGECLRE